MRLFERIRSLKLRIPGRKPSKPTPVLTYEEIDEMAKQDLIDEATEERMADIEALDAALRNRN
jgi:hypothetical protein